MRVREQDNLFEYIRAHYCNRNRCKEHERGGDKRNGLRSKSKVESRKYGAPIRKAAIGDVENEVERGRKTPATTRIDFVTLVVKRSLGTIIKVRNILK